MNEDAKISCYVFHTSDVMTKELADMGKVSGFNVRHLPKYLEVRQTEFTYLLLNNLLFYWKAAVTYLEICKNCESSYAVT